MISRKPFFLIFGLISLIVAVTFLFHRSRTVKIDIQPVWVKASQVQYVSLPLEIPTVGTLTAKSVGITPELAGHVEKIFFTDGAFVKKGTVLIQLNDAVYKAKYASANAKLIYSERNYNRMSLLSQKGIVTKQAIEQAEADLKEKKADIEEIEVMMNKMKLLAPFDGMVGKNKINLGDYVTIGQNIVTLTDVHHLRIEYNLPDKYLSSIKLGQQVIITTSAYPHQKFIATVAFISPTINVNSRSISLYATIIDNMSMLKPGMFAKVLHILNAHQELLMVPEKSLVPVMEGYQVYKIIAGKAYAVEVTTGKRKEGKVEIIKGISKEDTIVTDGQFKLKNNALVKVTLL